MQSVASLRALIAAALKWKDERSGDRVRGLAWTDRFFAAGTHACFEGSMFARCFALGCFIAGTTLGCRGPASDSPKVEDAANSASAAPLAAKWEATKFMMSSAKLTFPDGYGEAELIFEVNGLDYIVTCKKCVTAKVSAFGKPLAAGKSGELVLRSDIRALVADLPIKVAFPKFGVEAAAIKPQGDVEIGVPGAQRFVAALPELRGSMIGTAFTNVIAAPIVFGPDDTQPATARSVMFGSKVIGSAMKVKDIDLVAVERLPSRRPSGKTCKYVEGSFALDLQDIEVVVVERRTSKEVARKLFSAPPNCPRDGWSVGNAVGVTPDSDAIDRWVQTLIKR